MKHILCTLLVLFTLSTATDAAPRHRSKHRQPVEQVDTMLPQAADEAADEGIEAYSDTTAADGLAAGYDDTDDADQFDNIGMDPTSYNDPFSWFGTLWTLGIGGVMLAICIMLFLLLIFVLPIVLLILLVRYLSKRHSDNMAYRQAAAETVGQPADNKIIADFDEYTWRKGVSTTAVGAGLAALALCWASSILLGIGCLVVCIGLGRMYIGRHTKRNDFSRKNRPDMGDRPRQDL